MRQVIKYYPCPPLDPSVVKWLNETYPEKSPRQGETIEDLMWRGGMREVIRSLEVELDRQEQINVHEPAQTKEARTSPRGSPAPGSPS